VSLASAIETVATVETLAVTAPTSEMLASTQPYTNSTSMTPHYPTSSSMSAAPSASLVTLTRNVTYVPYAANAVAKTSSQSSTSAASPTSALDSSTTLSAAETVVTGGAPGPVSTGRASYIALVAIAAVAVFM
jgi:hypothetical protein